MKTNRILTPAAIALAMALAAPPVLAQSGNRDRRARDRSAQTAGTARQGTAARQMTQSRGEAVRRAEPSPETARGGTASGTRGSTTSRGAPPVSRPSASGTRRYTTSRGAPPPGRPSASGARGYATSRPVPPPAPAQRYDRGYNTHVPYGNYRRDAWRGRVQFGLGISIFAGNPFRFHFDYGWRPSFAYHYRMRPSLAYGGMSFVLDPYYTEVYIDGQFVGVASDFRGQPVPVAAGYHRIELYAPGFVPVAFDIRVFPGQVIPYRGSLYPVY
ncbi:MAG: hypothetical protein AB1806_11610 [Acidobacteriota bacterium]